MKKIKKNNEINNPGNHVYSNKLKLPLIAKYQVLYVILSVGK